MNSTKQPVSQGSPQSLKARNLRMVLPSALAIVGLALAGLVPGSITAGAQVATAADTPPVASSEGVLPGPLNGLSGKPFTVTLITGDVISVAPDSGGRYRIDAELAPRSDGSVRPILFEETPTSGLSAVPEDVDELRGAVDEKLFDLEYLARRGLAGKDSQLPVVVTFAGALDDAELAARGASLPGIDHTTLPDVNAVEVRVNPSHAVEFWDAITDQTQGGDPVRLAGGIARVSLKGNPADSGNVQDEPEAEQLYTVTQVLKNVPDSATNRSVGDYIRGFRPSWARLLDLHGNVTHEFGRLEGYKCVNEECDTAIAVMQVPAGVYMTFNNTAFMDPDRWTRQHVFFGDKEFRVAGDTTVEYDFSDAERAAVATPRPTARDSWVLVTENRVVSKGGDRTERWRITFGSIKPWFIPTQRVSSGSHTLKTDWQLTNERLTMDVLGAPHLQIHPIYDQNQNPWIPWASWPGLGRFHGNNQFQMIDANAGSAEDFANLDARGKLVLIDPPADSWACSLNIGSILERARDAGVAAILFWSSARQCPVPHEFGHDSKPPKIPHAEIPPSEGEVLRDLLASRSQVKVRISDAGDNPEYMYRLTFVERGRIPSTVSSYRVSDSNLAKVDTTFHARTRSVGVTKDEQSYGSFLPEEYFIVGLGHVLVNAPARWPVYYGPVGNEVVYDEYVYGPGVFTQGRYSVYDKSETIRRSWGARPAAPGPRPIVTVSGQPGKFFQTCAACRFGDTFQPVMWLGSGAPGNGHGSVQYSEAGIHLYQGDQEIPPEEWLDPFWGITTYELSPESARYRLTRELNNTYTTWNFSSSRPTVDETPLGFYCGHFSLWAWGSDKPCRAEPLIFLRYDAHVDPVNAVPAGTANQVEIKAFHLDPHGSAISRLRVWTSTDGGSSWQPASAVTGQGSGVYTATYTTPGLSATNGSVSLKVEAEDADGNDVSQTILDAYDLTPEQGRRSATP